MRSHLDLCSGIGGFALAAQWAGYTTIGFCEIDPWCRRVLAKNFPGVPQHDDLWTLTGATVRGWIGERAGYGAVAHSTSDAGQLQPRQRQGLRDEPAIDGAAGRLDLLTGGYPCQPFSLAGKRLGETDDRHLWPAIAALVAELQPRRCLFENVYGHVSMGLDTVLSDLETLGYACGAVVVPAAAVGAPHRRDRVWILADAGCPERRPGDSEGRGAQGEHDLHGGWPQGAGGVGERREVLADAPRISEREPTDHANTLAVERHARQEPRGGSRRQALGGLGQSPDGLPGRMARSDGWRVGPGVADPWAGDWEAGCPRTTTHEVDRVHKLKALGNAIVPQVAYQILRLWDAA